MSEKVTVISSYYNRRLGVDVTLKSLHRQSMLPNEVIVVDDGSQDDTADYVRSAYPDVKVIRQENAGLPTSLHTAICQAQGPIVAINDAGDMSYQRRLEVQADALDQHTTVPLVGSLYDWQNIDGTLYSPASQPDRALTAKELAKHNPLLHGSVMFRVAAYHDAGGYRSVFKFAQDWDLWLRMAERAELSLLGEVLCRRIDYNTSVSMDPEKRLLQKYFSSLARQCHRQRVQFGVDCVQAYGSNGMLMRASDARLGLRLAKGSAMAAIEGNNFQSIHNGSLARRELPWPLGGLASLTLSRLREWKQLTERRKPRT